MQEYLDLLIVLAILGTMIGVVLGVAASFIRLGLMLAPYLAAAGLILLLLQYIQ